MLGGAPEAYEVSSKTPLVQLVFLRTGTRAQGFAAMERICRTVVESALVPLGAMNIGR
jgi:hypothetical protein